MEVYFDLPAGLPPSVVTIGTFDGVHLGHQELLRRAVDQAKRDNLAAAVLTFDPHPAYLVRPDNAPKLLSDLDGNLRLFEQCGIDQVVVLRFDNEVAQVEPNEFIRRFLVEALNVRSVIVGEDFHFGHMRRGSVETLCQFGNGGGATEPAFEVHGVPLLTLESSGQPISSTAIRQALAENRLPDATAMLGRLFSIHGEVVEGDRRGRTIGFPTANIPMSLHQACPAEGVYAGWFTDQSAARYPCAINIGRRPTFYKNAEHVILEAHLLNFDQDLYGQQVKVEFVEFIRSEQRFNGVDELQAQLIKDVETCRAILV